MAEYPDFKHGAYGYATVDGLLPSDRDKSKQAFVYFGTAPVNQVAEGAKNVNKPILCRDISEARKMLGWSEDWAKYTLCEAMHVHFEINGTGPVIFINVLDPAKAAHQASTGGTASLTPANGIVTITGAEDAILDTVTVVKGTGQDAQTLVKGTDYDSWYNADKKTITIVELTAGALGTSALAITWTKVDPTAVTGTDVIGSTDTYGLNKGIYAVMDVYNVTGYIPAYLLAPGFSSLPAVHTALIENSTDISKHWNAWVFADIPLVDSSSNAITLANVQTWRTTNGYNKDNEDVFFPMATGTDGKKYHLATLYAANFQKVLIENRGIPYASASNTDCSIIKDLYFGESQTGRVYDDAIINRCLNANGINSAAYVGGRWVLWGMFAGSYNQTDKTSVNVFDVGLMMLYYLTNDFQHRRSRNVDKPMPINDLKSIVAEEQARVDALIGIGALTYGKVRLDATQVALSDVYQGDFKILFDITTTPLAKSLTAAAKWVGVGFEIYFAAMQEME